MAQEFDILIVGGGVIGLMNGWRLQLDGYRVVIVDAAPENSSLNSSLNTSKFAPTMLAAAGMLAPSFESDTSENSILLEKFGWKSLERWREYTHQLEEESGLSIDLRDEGTIGIALTEAELLALKKQFEEQDYAKSKFEWLHQADLQKLEPNLSPKVLGGYFSPNEKQLDPVKLYRALKQAFLMRGGHFLPETQVTEFIQSSGKIKGAYLNKDNREIFAPIALIASGSFLGRIPLTLGAGAKLPDIIPVKGEALAISIAPQSLAHVVRHSNAYLCPKSDGRIIVGATSLPHEDDLEVDGAHIEQLKAYALAMMTSHVELSEMSRWAGVRPATPNGLPVIGRYPGTPDGLFFAVGHYRNGILLAPATADLVCQLIAGDTKEGPIINPFTSAV